MIEHIQEFYKKTREERRKHLNLFQPCVERGGDSKEFRGLLAYFLNTTIPVGKGFCLCHACHNSKCSNPFHLYWGTEKDNSRDRVDFGWKPPRVNIETLRENGRITGKSNIGKPKKYKVKNQYTSRP